MRRYYVAMDVDNHGYQQADEDGFTNDIEDEINAWTFHEFDIRAFDYIRPESYIGFGEGLKTDSWKEYVQYVMEWCYESYDDNPSDGPKAYNQWLYESKYNNPAMMQEIKR